MKSELGGVGVDRRRSRVLRTCGARGICSLMLLVLLFSSGVVAQDRGLDNLSSEHQKWLEEEVVYIITDRERELFLSLETLEERERFIEAFWAKRDPNPATPQNEFKEEHYRRIEYANKFLGTETFLPGWKTDRGRMYITLGEPVQIQRFDGHGELVSTHVWFYQSEQGSGLPPFFYLVFFKKHDVGEYQLYHPILDGPKGLMAGGYARAHDDYEALEILHRISPELARVSLSLDPSDPGDMARVSASLGTELLISRIYDSATRSIRTDYLDAYQRYGDRVAAEYSFNFVPNRSVFAVLAGPEGTPFVHYSIEIDPENFVLETDEDQSRFYTTVDVTLEARDRAGTLVESDDEEVYFELSPSQMEEIKVLPLAFQAAFPLVPGEYTISVILKNRVVKQYTVAEEELRIVPIELGEPWMSDVVLAYGNEQPRVAGDSRTLSSFQIDEHRIYPAAEGLFALGDRVEAFVQVLGADPDSTADFVLLDGEEKLQSQPVRVGDNPGGAIFASLPLTGMPGGIYRLQVRLVDPSGRLVMEKAAEVQVSPRSGIPRPGFYSRRSFDVEAPGLLALRRADQWLRLGESDKARSELENAVAANNPELPEAKWRLAWVLIRSGEIERAQTLLEPMEASFPNQYEVVAGLGFAHYFSRNFSKAADYLERAMTIRPPDTRLLNALGDSWERLGDLERAREAYERSLKLEPRQKAVEDRLASLSDSSAY